MKKLPPKVKAGCGVIFVFGLGFVAGLIATFVIIVGLVQKTENWQTEESKNFFAKHVANELDLTDEQYRKFRPIVGEVLEKRWELRRDYLLENHTMVEETYFPRIAEFLTEAQKKKAQNMFKRWRNDSASKTRKAGSPAPEKEVEEQGHKS